MEILLAVLVGSGCAALGAWLIRRRRRGGGAGTGDPASDAPAAPENLAAPARGLGEARPDDVLIHEGRDWIVVGAARLTEGMDAWTECRLEDGDEERWMVFRPDDGDVVLLGVAAPDPGVGDRPSEALEREGLVYRLARFGRASASVTGAAGSLAEGELGYWDYERPGDHRAWIRGSGERWLYVFGVRVARHLIRFLPGS
jgi:hypothetical protein